ncbi:2'-5' RNA ligase family protein [Bradyrhizobium sp. AUGA SZCCT0222]|nr:2'-5' RNA ligase family protein [Bradyrhizobium sp. AUGA SZCCT0222]
MAFAVSLHFNSEIADAISARWARLANAGVSSSMPDLRFPPHVTLAVYDDLVVEAAVASLDRIFGKADQITVTLTDFSTFGAGSGVCYAALASSPDLMRLHATSLVRPAKPAGHIIKRDAGHLIVPWQRACRMPDWIRRKIYFKRIGGRLRAHSRRRRWLSLCRLLNSSAGPWSLLPVPAARPEPLAHVLRRRSDHAHRFLVP